MAYAGLRTFKVGCYYLDISFDFVADNLGCGGSLGSEGRKST